MENQIKVGQSFDVAEIGKIYNDSFSDIFKKGSWVIGQFDDDNEFESILLKGVYLWESECCPVGKLTITKVK